MINHNVMSTRRGQYFLLSQTCSSSRGRSFHNSVHVIIYSNLFYTCRSGSYYCKLLSVLNKNAHNIQIYISFKEPHIVICHLPKNVINTLNLFTGRDG